MEVAQVATSAFGVAPTAAETHDGRPRHCSAPTMVAIAASFDQPVAGVEDG